MTNRLWTTKSTQIFNEILKNAPSGQNDKKQRENYILKSRHKLSLRYQALLNY